MESQTDSRIFILPSPSQIKNNTVVEDYIKFNPHSLYYDMSKKGLAIIFNHKDYDTRYNMVVSKRDGTEFDSSRLHKCLINLNFDVKMCQNYTKKQIMEQMEEVRKKSRNDISCLLVVVLTHGEPGYLQARDVEYKVGMLWDRLTSKACPNLAGIPKLYFIQACRGDNVDPGSTMTDSAFEEPPQKKEFKIPSMADFLHMYSTYEDYTSWRETDGSWFIQSLCEVLEEEAEEWDLLQLLTFVNRKVAFEYESYTTDPESNAMKQIPQIKSMLTKLLKFKTLKSLY